MSAYYGYKFENWSIAQDAAFMLFHSIGEYVRNGRFRIAFRLCADSSAGEYAYSRA